MDNKISAKLNTSGAALDGEELVIQLNDLLGFEEGTLRLSLVSTIVWKKRYIGGEPLLAVSVGDRNIDLNPDDTKEAILCALAFERDVLEEHLARNRRQYWEADNYA